MNDFKKSEFNVEFKQVESRNMELNRSERE